MEGDWKFQQVFGDDSNGEPQEADQITAVEFDQSGEFIAIGDKGGRVVVLQHAPQKGRHSSVSSSRSSGSVSANEYRLYTEFQSHEGEFDYLKSLEIEEKINQIKFPKRLNDSLLMLTTNDKTIKLWKVQERKVKQISGSNFGNTGAPAASKYAINGNNLQARRPIVNPSQLVVPKVVSTGNVVQAYPRRIFSNGHTYHINSFSVNSDEETFISADDLRINLWNLEIADQSFNIVDIKPENMEELTEVITTTSFHPQHCHLFMYASSRGCIKLADMRQKALCDDHAKVFEFEEEESTKTFFSEIIASVSDAKFSNDGRYILSRDYMTLKLWDINMESKPVKIIDIHEHLRSKLCELYENDCIFDKFLCSFSGDGKQVLTGSYQNLFQIFDRQGKVTACMEASRNPVSKNTRRKLGRTRSNKKLSPGGGADQFYPTDPIDFDKKAMQLAWHPSRDVIAVAASNYLYVYSTN